MSGVQRGKSVEQSAAYRFAGNRQCTAAESRQTLDSTDTKEQTVDRRQKRAETRK
jgi:hypothetical protein